MTEAQLFEKIGRQSLEIEDRKEQYAKLLDLLARIVGGEISVSRVLVNLTDQTYSWCEPGKSPEMPCTINGLPRCVVAPAPETGLRPELASALNGEGKP